MANILLSMYAWNNRSVFDRWMLHPYSFQRKKTYFTLFTSAFIHADTVHLAMNMFVLFSFGRYVEADLSSLYYGILYLLGIVFSAIPSLIKYKNSQHYYTLGASGAVSAVVFAFIILYPFAKLSLFLLPISIPAILFGVLYIVFSIYAQRRAMDNLNHDAHIAGALTGVGFIILLKPYSITFLMHTFGIGL
ncbi:MAG: rhomboid family intramembrane serine protease [Bacteroidia bacterium]|nr:rhomboid family intramembrane serine protease [Bacteroidia bacterium]